MRGENDDREHAELSERIAVEETYARLNHLWKIHGLAAITAFYSSPHGRAELMGLDHSEVDRIVASTQVFYAGGRGGDWLSQWTKAGDEYRARAREAATLGHRETAAKLFLIATACYFYGTYIIFDFRKIPAREDTFALAVETYAEGASCYDPPAERIEIPFGPTVLPAYLRVPAGADRPACVVIVGGANSTKEDNHPIADYFLRRGIATFLFDGPGQGEFVQRGGQPLRAAAYDTAVRTALDWLQRQTSIDARRIGLFGKSTGGLLVLRAAANEPRVRAVVCHPGSYSWAPYFVDRFPFFPSQLEVANMLGAHSRAELLDLVASEMTVEGLIEDVRCPVLTVNGTEEMIPASEPQLIKEHARTEVRTAFFPGRIHGGPPALAHSFEADWLREKLT